MPTHASSDGFRLTIDVAQADDVEVLVIGGGPAGIAAAVAAARAGATTMLVEQYGFLGGAATASLVGPFMTSFSGDGQSQIVGGVFEELVRRMEEIGGARHPSQVRFGTAEAGYWIIGHDHVTPFDPEAMRLVAGELVLENAVNLRLHTRFVLPVVREGRACGAVVHSKSGLQAIAAQVVIDCSGDADFAYGAGAPTEKGRAGDGATQPMTMFFRVGGIVDAAVQAYVSDHPDEKGKLFQSIVRDAKEKGDFPVARDRVGVYRTPQEGVWRVNTSRLQNLDGTRVEDLTRAEIEGRRQVSALMRFFRKYLPGFENAVLLDTAAQVGVRETRRVVGEYTITVDDLVSGRHFYDVIALGSYPADLHPPDSDGGGIDTAIAMGIETANLYEIPYRALLPQCVENLVAAGRCISASHEALGAVRVMPTCFAMGQAAGVAAAIAAENGEPVRSVDVSRLQALLSAQGAILAMG